jgi:hypothetical protein
MAGTAINSPAQPDRSTVVRMLSTNVEKGPAADLWPKRRAAGKFWKGSMVCLKGVQRLVDSPVPGLFKDLDAWILLQLIDAGKVQG